MTRECDPETMAQLVEEMAHEPDAQIERLDDLIGRYPEDARLHFLRGSALASCGRLIEAHRSLTQAVGLAPDFAIARFQLGFFQLTSGEAANALDTWGRLDALPNGNYLRCFTDGLRALIRDDFGTAIAKLREGIGLNAENAPLNHDMRLIIDRCLPLAAGVANDEDAQSETALILRQFKDRSNPQ